MLGVLGDKLIEKYGLEYFKDVCREYIEDSRRLYQFQVCNSLSLA